MPSRAINIDSYQVRRRRFANIVHSLVLIAAMMLLLAACGWIVAGWTGVLTAALAGSLAVAVSTQLAPQLVLRLFRAQPLEPDDLPDIESAIEVLAIRAGLEFVPEIYYVKSPTLNAFSVGQGEHAAVTVTTGLLHAMTPRELVGVLAHEISHIRNNDVWVMGIADVMSRLTRVLSLLGALLLVLHVPLSLSGQTPASLALVLLLLAAPTLGNLLQLALSRTREFEADLSAARLTGDPLGLAKALEKLERIQGQFWEDVFLGGRRIPDPSLLRSHPRTEERISRLLELRAEVPRLKVENVGAWSRSKVPSALAKPRFRVSGLWY